MVRSAPAALAAAVLCLIALLAVGCGGDGGEQDAQSGGIQLAAPINLADCRDWNEGSVEERLGTIREISEFTGGQIAGTEGKTGSTLDDEKAYELFESYCANEFARGFKLYKLYGRAAAFSGAATEQQTAP